MARGWESKAVEGQLDEAAAAAVALKRSSATLVAAESFEIHQKRQGLQLMRSQLLSQLSNARSVTHRQMIHQSLKAIEEELQKFDT